MAITADEIIRLGLRQEIIGVNLAQGTRRAGKWSRRVIRRLGLSVRVEGEPPPGAALLVCNHRSYFDIALILSSTPCVFVAKEEVKLWPILGRGARMVGTVFVKRESGSSRRDSRGAIQRALSRGFAVAVFPEGTTTRGPGTQRFSRGSFEVAAEAGCPVVPVALCYDDDRACFVDDDTFIGHFLRCFRRGRLGARICFGPKLEGEDGGKLCEQAQNWIDLKLNELEGNLQLEEGNEQEEISLGVSVPAGRAASP